MTSGTGDWQPTRGHVPAPCEARRYWSLNPSIRISNEWNALVNACAMFRSTSL